MVQSRCQTTDRNERCWNHDHRYPYLLAIGDVDLIDVSVLVTHGRRPPSSTWAGFILVYFYFIFFITHLLLTL